MLHLLKTVSAAARGSRREEEDRKRWEESREGHDGQGYKDRADRDLGGRGGLQHPKVFPHVSVPLSDSIDALLLSGNNSCYCLSIRTVFIGTGNRVETVDEKCCVVITLFTS